MKSRMHVSLSICESLDPRFFKNDIGLWPGPKPYNGTRLKKTFSRVKFTITNVDVA